MNSNEEDDIVSDTETLDGNDDINTVATWIENYNDNSSYYYRFVPESDLNNDDINDISENLSRILINSTINVSEDSIKISYKTFKFDLSFNNGSRGYIWRIADIAKY